MPWSNQSGPGNGGRKPGGPWGQGPSGGGNGSGGGNRPPGSGGGGGSGPGNQPPDLEDLLKRSKDSLRSVTQGSGPSGGIAFALAAVMAAVVGFYAFTFRVNPDEYGVVLRFGKFDRGADPGLHFKLPYPIEEVRKPTVPRQNTIEIGNRATSTGRSFNSSGRSAATEGLMLTADENIVDVDFIVFWRIKATAISDYLFNIANPENTVREVAESAMREIVGQTNIQPLLTDARQKTEVAVQKLMQTTLDTYKAGIQIDQVQLRAVDPPQQVIAAFREVQSARNERDQLVNEANTYFNKIVPEAKGEADRIRIQAEGYRQQTVAEALGQASRFSKVLDEYKKAPEVTRQRLYLETMERVLSGTDKIIIDNKGGGQGVVPFLPLDQLTRKKEGN